MARKQRAAERRAKQWAEHRRQYEEEDRRQRASVIAELDAGDPEATFASGMGRDPRDVKPQDKHDFSESTCVTVGAALRSVIVGETILNYGFTTDQRFEYHPVLICIVARQWENLMSGINKHGQYDIDSDSWLP